MKDYIIDFWFKPIERKEITYGGSFSTIKRKFKWQRLINIIGFSTAILVIYLLVSK